MSWPPEPPLYLHCRCDVSQRVARRLFLFEVWQCDRCGHKIPDHPANGTRRH